MGDIKAPRHEMRACGHCGKGFKVYACQAKLGLGKHCSNACKLAARNRHDEVAALLPATVYEVAKDMGWIPRVAGHALRQMIKNGAAHPSGVKVDKLRPPSLYKSNTTLVYSRGPAPNKDIPLDNLKTTLAYFHDEAILAAMPNSAPAIVRKTGITETTVRDRIALMRAAGGLTHIKRWKHASQGPDMPVHEAGPGIDAECDLEPRTNQEKYQRWLAKVTRSGKIISIRERRRVNREFRKLRLAGDPLVNALFGAPRDRINHNQERK